MNLVLIGGALGGIGLFLLGMRLMTEGLKVAAGHMLRDILTRWTRSRLRALFSGVLITGLVQSSSAVTVASIGFVNAGVLTLGQAMWVIFGSNVGTTMTGWVVAVVGFDIKIEAFALPLLGAGMFLSLMGSASRRGALGEAIAGFGVFFLGIATLKATFAGLGKDIDLAAFAEGGFLNDALFVLIGFVMTSLVQSSSAVIAIALTAAAGGVLTLETGAALVIGANVGTTTTALLAVVGATPNAKRVAVSHVVFNLLTGACALALLPLLLLAISMAEKTVPLGVGSTATLALFHTVFNLLGVALMWPMADRLESWVRHRFTTQEEDESRSRHLDDTLLQVPELAVKAVLLELTRVADISLDVARSALTDGTASAPNLWRKREVINHLNDAIVHYIQALGAAKSSSPIAAALTHPIRALIHYADIADHALAIVGRRTDIAALPADTREHLDAVAALGAAQVDAGRRQFADPTHPPPTGDVFRPAYDRAKVACLEASTRGGLNAAQVETALETLSDVKEIARLLDRVGKRVAALQQAVAPDSSPLSETSGLPAVPAETARAESPVAEQAAAPVDEREDRSG